MLWNWYTIDACFLSESWQITSHGAFAATCIGIMLMVILLEALRRAGKMYDDWILASFKQRADQVRRAAAATSTANSSVVDVKGVCPANTTISTKAFPGARTGGVKGVVKFRATPVQQLIRAVIHALTFGLAYIIMLLAMYYNGYIIICIIIGAGIGKFVCDWMTQTIILNNDEEDSVAGGNAPGTGAAGIEEPSVCCG